MRVEVKFDNLSPMLGDTAKRMASSATGAKEMNEELEAWFDNFAALVVGTIVLKWANDLLGSV